MDREKILTLLRSAIRSESGATTLVAHHLSTVPAADLSAAERQDLLFGDHAGKLPATTMVGECGPVLAEFIATGTVADPLAATATAVALLRTALDRVLAELPDGIDAETVGTSVLVESADPTVARLVDVAVNRRGERRSTGDGRERVSHDRVAQLATLAGDAVVLVPQRARAIGWTCTVHADRSATVQDPSGELHPIPTPRRANATPLSEAARKVLDSIGSGGEVNGWEFWEVRMADGSAVPITDYLAGR
jgi:hypothetical protein